MGHALFVAPWAQAQAHDGEKDDGGVGVADHSSHVVLSEVSVLALREVCGREWEMWNREKRWEMEELWSKENLVAISSCVDGYRGRHFRENVISTWVENWRSSIVQVLASATIELGGGKGG